MVIDLSHVMGYVGAVISVCAYLPQIRHLLRERCSAGLSIRSFAIWLVAAALLLAHAVMIHSDVFMALELGSIIALAVIVLLALRYRGQACSAHQPRA